MRLSQDVLQDCLVDITLPADPCAARGMDELVEELHVRNMWHGERATRGNRGGGTEVG